MAKLCQGLSDLKAKKGVNESLNIAEILMSALEAGSTAGGDKRCGEKKASSAFIVVAKPNDKYPYLNLNIFGQRKGGQNAVILLRRKFEKWKKNTNRNTLTMKNGSCNMVLAKRVLIP